MADLDCKWCGGTGRIRLLTSLVPCDCDETNTATATITNQPQIGSRISPLRAGGREYAFVADDNGWGTKYIWEVYNRATNGLLERAEPANGQPDDFYRRFIYKFPFAGDFAVRLLVQRGTVTESTVTRVTVS